MDVRNDAKGGIIYYDIAVHRKENHRSETDRLLRSLSDHTIYTSDQLSGKEYDV